MLPRDACKCQHSPVGKPDPSIGLYGTTKNAQAVSLQLFRRTRTFLLAILLTDAALTSASAQIAFEDVSIAAGLGNTETETWGASWGDLDGDHYPDLFSSNHRMRATLFHNNRDGTFTDVSKQVDLSQTPGLDRRSSRTSIPTAPPGATSTTTVTKISYETVSSGVDQFWINNGGKLTLRPVAQGIDKLRSRSNRQDLFFDYNGDGLLDMASIGLTYPELLSAAPDGTFGSGLGHSEKPWPAARTGQWGHLTDINAAARGLR